MQRELRAARLALAAAAARSGEGARGGDGADAFQLRPIGTVRSCFSKRNGTPRQPLLVPAARAVLTLRCGPSLLRGSVHMG